MITQLSYFANGDTAIPNTDKPEVSTDMTAYIARLEPELLRQLLGVTLYNGFIAGLAVTPIADKWLSLREGAEFTNSAGQLEVYGGIKSILTAYIFFYYSRDNASKFTGVGEVSNATDNSVRISPIDRQVRVWNDMVGQIRSLYWFLTANTISYNVDPYSYTYYRVSEKYQPINSLNI